MTLIHPSIRRSWSAAAASLLLASAAPVAGAANAPQLLDHVVAIVNDEAITSHELEQRMKMAEAQLEREKIAAPAPDVLRKQVLERMIVDRAQLQLAREDGVRVDDVTVNAAIQRIADQNKLTLQQLREQLEREGTTFARFREDIRDEITMSRLREREVDSRIQVSEGEIDNFLEEQGAAGDAAVEYDLAQIMLRLPENAPPERIEEVRRRAEDLRAQAAAGADFAKLAVSYSAGSEALRGGDIGWRAADRLPPLFVEAVKRLSEGGITQVLRSPGGFHVVKLLGRRSANGNAEATGPVQQTHVRHILLRVSDTSPEPDVQHRLVDLRNRIVEGGQDFGQLARLHSVDGSSTRGGDLGWIYPGDLVPEFERAMNDLKIGEISQPVKSPFGYHLIQVLERRTEENAVDRKRLAARQSLRERRTEEATLEWMRQLRDRTYVEYRED